MGVHMLWMAVGIAGFFILALVGAVFDPIGWGYLLSSRVDDVADARLTEPAFGMPWLYFVGALCAGLGVAAASEYGVLVSFLLGAGLATFLLVTVWDMRRRRGSLAVYIRIRRGELGFDPVGEVIEVPKLMFGVMNEPGPVVWLMLAGVAVVFAVDLWPRSAYYASVPLLGFSLFAIMLWRAQTRGPWEPLARRLRRASFVRNSSLEEYLESALDVDPEVIMIRQAADSMVARVMGAARK